MDQTTALYRHFADDGSLLYVGISLSWPARTKSHVRGSRWFEQVAKVEIEHFPTREAALLAEREAIKREKPEFNVVHNRAETKRPKAVFYTPISDDPSALALMSSNERRMLRAGKNDPLLKAIKGPDVIVGPALVYRDDFVSVVIADGQRGCAGKLTEVILGQLAPDVPDWAHMCATVMVLRTLGDITLDEARKARSDIVSKLKKHLRSVEVFDTDIALAVANASTFPSANSRQILDEVAVERGVMT